MRLATALVRTALVVTVAGARATPPPNAAQHTILVVQETKHAYLVDLRTGRKTELAPARGWETNAAVWTPDGSAVVLLRVKGYRSSIWIIDASGRHLRALTHPPLRRDGTGDDLLEISPDGTQLAFERRNGERNAIGVVPLSGGPERIIGPGTDLSGWTRDGHGLCLRTGVFHRGLRTIRVSSGPIYRDGCRRQTWLPDGSRSLFVRGDRHGGTQIWIRTRAGREVKLTNDIPRDPIARVQSYAPVWSPDGSRIAFISVRSRGPDLYVIRADGTGERRLTWNARVLASSWSADGKTIAFLGHYPQAAYLVPAAGGAVRHLPTGRGEIESVSWQPAHPSPPFMRPALVPRRARRLRVLPTYFPRRKVRVVQRRRYGYQAQTGLFDMSPDGRFVSYYEDQDALGLYDLARGVRRPLVRTTHKLGSAGRFSPDGGWVTFQVGRRLGVVSPVTGVQRTVAHDAGRGGAMWLRDGRLAYTTVGRRLVFISLEHARTPQPFRIPNPPGSDDLDFAYAVSPDGTRILYSSGCALWLRDLRLRHLVRVHPPDLYGNVVSQDAWAPDSSKFVASNGAWNDLTCRRFGFYPPSENTVYSRNGRRLGIAPGGGTHWSRDSRWLTVFDGQHGTSVGGSQPLDVVSFPDRRIASILGGANSGPAFVGPGNRILYGRFVHPEAFDRPGDYGAHAHPELWLGRLR